MNEKIARLESIIKDAGSVLIAYSGGADSALLAYAAHSVLGSRAVAVTAASPVYPSRETEAALSFAQVIGIRHIISQSNNLNDPSFAANDKLRCYYCKKSLYLDFARIASDEGLDVLVDGSNSDDEMEYRPGRLAAAELGVRSPLCEAGIGKDDVVSISRELSLSTWDKPHFSCLATSIPHGTPITEALLRRISEAEGYLRSLAIRGARVRHQGDTARIEARPDEAELILREAKTIVEKFRYLGYTYITVDSKDRNVLSADEMPGPDAASVGFLDLQTGGRRL